MLSHFQVAFADLIASPELIAWVRAEPEILRSRYDLTDVEWRRLVSVIDQPGMAVNCILYRANRFTPIVLNLPGLCEVLSDRLRPLLSEFWAANIHTNANFLIESYHFCEFVMDKIDTGLIPGESVLPTLEREMADIAKQLKAIYPKEHLTWMEH